MGVKSGPRVGSSSREHACTFPFPSPSPTGVHPLNSKGPQETCNQGQNGQLLLPLGLPSEPVPKKLTRPPFP